ncbi:uncharacterized protein RMCC_0871 [Mycolicibacterium canariasense]|uniref:Uncharacterized protein n=1 Tax=Mycolicibacterium canariasense TaxID=228230 RepID=A0A124E1K1_MYCCR|nr:hypothetical protein [Mycolicibacterium canariasense]MCV7213260.1 hypothetical protein [Mycolicibacterium canariasense]ORV19322.1 hypothetical protein AWB94_32765 [Mycolicibacterium canariasense]GAS93905.1 uncharacterized protein RMCC_0871 [Mycolicibacterium canariasense]
MPSPITTDTPQEAPATVGLLLNFAALITITAAFALGLDGRTGTAVLLAVAGLGGFIASLVCFAMDSLDSSRVESPLD